MRRSIRRIDRRLSEHRSSVDLYELSIRFEQGTTLELMAKAANWHALAPEAQRAKPPHLWNDQRELRVYADILGTVDLGTARYFGEYHDQRGIRYLVLERINGIPLWQCGDFNAWRAAARWLARLHQRVSAASVMNTGAGSRLLNYDRPFYLSWMDRARTFATDTRPALGDLLTPHRRAVDHLLSQPVTFLHGEFYSANVLVSSADTQAFVIRPIDWEMASIGPGLIDVAYLASGRWSDEQRADLADAYYDEVAAHGGHVPPREGYLRTLDACLVHLAVQNLGWSAEWTPPPDRTHDWLGEALRLSEKWG